MPMQNDIALLDKRMVAGVKKYIKLAKERLDITLTPLETLRSLDVQYAYYARGRCPAEVVKAYFMRSRLWNISASEANAVNTKTLYSKHIEGLAIDIIPMKDGKPWWACPREVWYHLFRIAEEECGLDACAGGKYESWQWDWPHHEFRVEIKE